MKLLKLLKLLLVTSSTVSVMLPELEKESYSAAVKSERRPAINTNTTATATAAAITAIMRTVKQTGRQTGCLFFFCFVFCSILCFSSTEQRLLCQVASSSLLVASSCKSLLPLCASMSMSRTEGGEGSPQAEISPH